MEVRFGVNTVESKKNENMRNVAKMTLIFVLFSIVIALVAASMTYISRSGNATDIFVFEDTTPLLGSLNSESSILPISKCGIQ